MLLTDISYVTSMASNSSRALRHGRPWPLRSLPSMTTRCGSARSAAGFNVYPRPFSWIDHLIRPQQQGLRDREPEGLRR